MKAWALCLAAALAVGVGLRLFRLDQSFRVDEIEAWAQSQRPMAQILADKTRPPHSGVLSQLSCRLLGDGEASFRLPYAVYGILGLPLLFLIGRRLWDERVGALACLLLALSPCHIQFSQEARYYALLMLYPLAALYCMIRALDEAEARSWAGCTAYWTGFMLSHALAISLHRFALYPLGLCAGFILALLCSALWRGKRGAVGLVLGAAAVLACAGLLAWQWAGLREFLFAENIQNRAIPLRESYLRWHYRPPGASIVWEFVEAFSGGKLLGGFFLMAAAAGSLAAGRAGLRRSAALWLWAGLPVASLFVIRSQTHFELRYFIFVLPVWLLLAAAGIVTGADSFMRREFGPRAARRAALAGLAGVVLLLDARALSAYYRLPKARMRETFAHIGAHSRPGDAVLFYPPWDVLWYGYYRLPEGRALYLPAIFFARSPAFSPEAVVRTHERLWLAATWVKDPVRAQELAALKESLERYYSLAGETSFPSRDPNDDYEVYLWQRRPDQPPRSSGPNRLGGTNLGLPKDPFLGRKIRMALNLDEAGEGMAASRKTFFQALDNTALLRAPASSSAALAPAARFCRQGCTALVWAGRGRLGDARTGMDFEAQDLFYLPAGGGLALSSPGGALLVLQRAEPFDSPAPAAEKGRWSRLTRLGSGSGPDDGACGDGRSAVPGGPAWVFCRSLRPGAGETEARTRQAPWQLVTGIVLAGQVHVEDTSQTHILDFHAGDLYLYGRSWPERWSWSNRQSPASRELRVVTDRARIRPDISMSSSTGKTGGLWAPMLLQ